MALYKKHENGLVAWLLAFLLLSAGCGGGGTEPPASSPTPERTPPAEVPGMTGTPPAAATAPTTRGVVMTSRELRMSVSGPGVGHIDRSLDVLERQIIALLPGMRDAYDGERAHEPALMGSLDVSVTIEPSGAVSEVRFPVRRVSNEWLTTAAFNQIRTWIFPPAEQPVSLRFSLLFIPPSVDEAAILLWEQRLGSRPIIEKGAEAPASAATIPSQEPERTIAAAPTQERPQAAAAAPSTPEAVLSAEPVRWYRVTRNTVLRTEPRESADVVRQLRKGIRVRVVGMVKGRWLEVHSVSKRPPGFLWWRDADPEPDSPEPRAPR